MRFSRVTREEFLGLLASDGNAEAELVADANQLIEMLGGDDRLACVWAEGVSVGATLPAAILVPHDQVRDFLAWSVTYLEGYGPITALCRVLDRDEVGHETPIFLPPELPGVDAAYVGAVIGEAWTLYTLAGRVSGPSLSSCLSTYSFATARARALNASPVLQRRLGKEWKRALRLTEQPSRQISVSDLERPWRVVGSLANRNLADTDSRRSLLRTACQQLMSRGEVRPELLGEIGGEDVGMTWNGANGTREERVLRLKSFMEQAADWESSQQERASFLLGYLASRIAPGSLEHIGLLQPAVRQHRTAVVWYGICAGISGRARLLSDSRGLGWRVLRELLRWERVEERPRADVAVEELELLAAQGVSVRAMGTSLRIELLPFCTASFKRQDTARRGVAEQSELFVRRAETPKKIIDKLAGALHEATAALAAIEPSDKKRVKKPAKERKKRGRARE